MEFKHYFQKWKAGHLSDAELAIIFFLHFHLKKFPNKKLASLLKQDKFQEAFTTLTFKKVKNKAINALNKWLAGEWNFQILLDIPGPYQVLDFQARGIRPVSLIFQDELLPILNRDDCLEFFLHDLEHGHMFFYDDDLQQMQLQFFQNIQKSLNTGLWETYLKDEEFKQRFYYLISDMNTHQEHYRFFLKSMIPQQEFHKFEILF